MRYIALIFAALFWVTPVIAEQAGIAPKEIHVSDLKAAIAALESSVHIFDANTAKTRQKDGIIPGAKLLSSSSDYDTTTELPANKSEKLVFYCYNPSCSASHTAAKRAVGAGYQDVAVMVDGIVGWKESGQATEKAPA